MSELKFDQVRIRFGTRRHGLVAVDGVDLVVPDGKIVGLVGESGSGKSTLARAAVGLVPISGGRILLDGRPLPRRGRRPVHMVFQDPYSSLDPRMTVGKSIAEATPPQLVRDAAGRYQEVARLLGLVELEPSLASAYPAQLSGGQRQRVALARALAGRPGLLIADEVTSALDVSIQGAVLNLMRSMHRQLKLSMLFISHNLAVVRYISDIIAVIYLGRVVECGPADQVLGDPQHPYTRDLLAAVPDLDTQGLAEPEADPARRAVSDAELADPHHLPPGCRYHPRCPVGPLIRDDRDICVATEPTAVNHRNLAACHFALESDLIPGTVT